MDNYASGGRRRAQSSHSMEALDQVIKQAECKLAARRQARAEAREIRMRELERQQKVADENADKMYDMFGSTDLANKNPRVVPGVANGRGMAVIPSPISNNSRRSSEDSLEENFNYRDLKLELKEAEEKFRKAMIQNAQLDNEKSAVTYQVELYKDKYQDLEENYSTLQSEYKEKCREYEQLKRLFSEQQENTAFYKYELEERDRLIQEQGLVILTIENSIDRKDVNVNGSTIDDDESNNSKNDSSNKMLNSTTINDGSDNVQPARRVLVSMQSAELLNTAAGYGSLDDRLKHFAQEKKELSEEMSKLKLELEEERRRSRSGHFSSVLNGTDCEDFEDIQKESSRLAGDYKFKWQKAEQDISTLQANVARLESQVIRYKSAAETSERVEDELKVERRKLQRELREAQSKVEELETANTHLQRRLDKLKNAKSALLKEI